MKKLYFITLFMIIILFLFGVRNVETVKIGLIPLDSRPANTQYPQILGLMVNVLVEIPGDHLDNFLEPASKEELWNWLEENIKDFDQVIINTTQLFNGSLIASRDPTSYTNIEEDLNKLREFCQENKKKKITVITILPRLLPSQFTELWDYRNDLIAYAREIDKNEQIGKEPPQPPPTIPDDILQGYLSIYDKSREITDELILMTNQGLIDQLLIGQDDAEEFGLSNKIVQEIKPLLSDRIHFVQGADELTMLALARNVFPKSRTEVKVLFANEDLKNAFFPFESQKLEEILQTKMEYINIGLKDSSKLEKENQLLFLYNDPQKFNVLQNFISENIDEFSFSDDSYFGIIDIAYTNKGDVRLYEYFLNDKINKNIQGYAGWNTASNTIGTELVHFFFYQHLSKNLCTYSEEAQNKALEAYIKFKFIRVVEDLLYQGILRDKLNEELKEKGLDPANLGENKSEAEVILQGFYEDYREELENAFRGEHQLGKIKFTVDNITSRLELPWSRTFEVKVVPEVEITIQ